ncbi:putative phage abortive infection protein [Pectobacterium parmentieri]|uniref:putative phage abortive infection protein n=1 Tax=Pectobacterium parmentieri TaxID=1905730 RepID=UPI0013C4B6A2|nr:putative phage abortive infection protein [Pectobacterium parmentieri]
MGNTENLSLKYILYIVIAIVIFWVAYELFVFIYEHVTGLIALASATGTVWAAMATWRAAEKAAESAQIARESMNTTAELGRQTLEETQRANKRTAFENRYALLLAQHDQYHRQLCNYLDTGQLGNRKDENSEEIKLGQGEIDNFFKISIHSSTLDSCFAFLTGHEIISRYMRTLYHLLKFVSQECVFNEINDVRNQKNYISPVRSTIRNDVLLLIAVNSLNVREQRAKESSYPYYQKLLHKFDFFEHAIFIFPSKPNELFKRDDWEEKIQGQIFSVQSKFYNNLRDQQNINNHSFRKPVVEFRSPLMMVILIFKNPVRNAALRALNTLKENWHMNSAMTDFVEQALKIFEDASKYTHDSLSIEFMIENGTSWEPLKKDVISTIQKEAFHKSCHYDSYLFKYPTDETMGVINGSDLRYYFRGSERNKNVASEVEACNGIEGYVNQYKQDYDERLKEFFDEIDMYNVVSDRYISEERLLLAQNVLSD